MVIMTQFEEAIQRYWALHPASFSVLDSFKVEHHYSTDNTVPKLTLKLEMKLRSSFNPDDDRKRLKLSFLGATELRLEVKSVAQFPLITISSMDELQWERLKYQISDEENNQLSFYCEDFEAIIEE